jgi:hypothetical protein
MGKRTPDSSISPPKPTEGISVAKPADRNKDAGRCGLRWLVSVAAVPLTASLAVIWFVLVILPPSTTVAVLPATGRYLSCR